MLLFAGLFVKIDAMEMFKTVMYTVLIPILGGIVLRELAERKRDVKNYVSAMPAISATIAMLPMFMAINSSIPAIVKNLQILPPLVISTAIIFPAVSFYQVFKSSIDSEGMGVMCMEVRE